MNRSRAQPLPPWKRNPAFTPVPLRTRADGWTPRRQALFVGWLAETGSVTAAAARVGCSRESAYRLRRKRGAESFAAAWDAACGQSTPKRKFTFEELAVRAERGPLQVRLYRKRFRGVSQKPDNSALLRVLAQLDRSERQSRAEPE